MSFHWDRARNSRAFKMTRHKRLLGSTGRGFSGAQTDLRLRLRWIGRRLWCFEGPAGDRSSGVLGLDGVARLPQTKGCAAVYCPSANTI